MKVALLTGGGDKPYALGLLDAVVSRGVIVDFIASDELCTPQVLGQAGVNFLNLRGSQNPTAPRTEKVTRILRYYGRLLKYALQSDSRIFHILWANRFVLLERVLLLSLYKLLGKKVVFTAHNVNEKERDGGDSLVNRLTLRAMYGMVDHIFVHTQKMKAQLISQYGISDDKITIIPFGINNTLPQTAMTRSEARARLSLEEQTRVALFFGNIAAYKGLEYAIEAVARLRDTDHDVLLLVAGQIKGCQPYWDALQRRIEELGLGTSVVSRIDYIPDDQVEIFFKAADVVVLPYRFIYQSGVLFLSYSFGLPVIATDVGSLREDIVEGKTGLICEAENPDELAAALRRYFASDLYRDLDLHRKEIVNHANRTHSWERVSSITYGVYKRLLDAPDRV